MESFDYYVPGDKRYFWRVQDESGNWSQTASFIVSDEEPGDDLVSAFVMHGTFPNPFRNRTTFSYFIPFPSHVRVEVFDMLGRSVRVPIDQIQPEGQHYVPFDAEDLPSGTYVYTFTVGDRTVTKTMVVAR